MFMGRYPECRRTARIVHRRGRRLEAVRRRRQVGDAVRSKVAVAIMVLMATASRVEHSVRRSRDVGHSPGRRRRWRAERGILDIL